MSSGQKRERRQALKKFEQKDIKRVAKKASLPVPVYQLPHRHPMRKDQIIEIAKWLHHNLPIRVAGIVMRFQGLPFSLAIREDVLEAQEKYIDTYLKISMVPEIVAKTDEKTWENVLAYTKCLDDTLVNHEDMLPLLIKGFSDLTMDRRKVEAAKFMNNIIGDRLALRLICNHQVEIVKEYNNRVPDQTPRFMGVFDMKFNLVELVERVYGQQQDECISMFGTNVPELKWDFVKADRGLHLNDKEEFKYIPHALEFILNEIFRNALMAQIKSHQNENGVTSVKAYKPIKVQITANKHDFIIKISDKGDGVDHEKVDNIWNYHIIGDEKYSGKEKDGCGLPISKVYAERMGGSLCMETIQGYGTDVFIRLPYLGNEKNQRLSSLDYVLEL